MNHSWKILHKPTVAIVVALECEAKEIIRHYKLSNISMKPWRLYCNKDENIFLIISGVSSILSSAATAYLHALCGSRRYISYLNIGVAGSKSEELGELFFPSKIYDEASQLTFFPFINTTLKINFKTLITRSKFISEYPESEIVDMEGSGFFLAAKKCVSIEQICILKIISDNKNQNASNLDKNLIYDLMSLNKEKIIEVINFYLDLSKEEYDLYNYSDTIAILEKFHFTKYQEEELKKLSKKFKTIYKIELNNFLSKCKTSTECLQLIKDKINTYIMSVK